MSVLRRWRHHVGPWWLTGVLAVFWGSLLMAQQVSDQRFTRASMRSSLSAEDLRGVSTVRITERAGYGRSPIGLEFSANSEVVIDANGLLNDFDHNMPLKVVRMGEVLAIHVNVDEQSERPWQHRFSIQRIRLPSSVQRVEGHHVAVGVDLALASLEVSACDARLTGNGAVDRLVVSDWADCRASRESHAACSSTSSGSCRSSDSDWASVRVKVNQHLQMITQARYVELGGDAVKDTKQVDLKLSAYNTALSVDFLRPLMNSQIQGVAAAWRLVEIQVGDSPNFPLETAEKPGAGAVEIRPKWQPEP